MEVIMEGSPDKYGSEYSGSEDEAVPSDGGSDYEPDQPVNRGELTS